MDTTHTPLHTNNTQTTTHKPLHTNHNTQTLHTNHNTHTTTHKPPHKNHYTHKPSHTNHYTHKPPHTYHNTQTTTHTHTHKAPHTNHNTQTTTHKPLHTQTTTHHPCFPAAHQAGAPSCSPGSVGSRSWCSRVLQGPPARTHPAPAVYRRPRSAGPGTHPAALPRNSPPTLARSASNSSQCRHTDIGYLTLQSNVSRLVSDNSWILTSRLEEPHIQN